MGTKSGGQGHWCKPYQKSSFLSFLHWKNQGETLQSKVHILRRNSKERNCLGRKFQKVRVGRNFGRGMPVRCEVQPILHSPGLCTFFSVRKSCSVHT